MSRQYYCVPVRVTSARPQTQLCKWQNVLRTMDCPAPAKFYRLHDQPIDDKSLDVTEKAGLSGPLRCLLRTSVACPPCRWEQMPYDCLKKCQGKATAATTQPSEHAWNQVCRMAWQQMACSQAQQWVRQADIWPTAGTPYGA